MKIVEINSVNIGSTGNIMLDIASKARERGHMVYVACANTRDCDVRDYLCDFRIGHRYSYAIHRRLALITGLNGCFSFFSTLWFIIKISRLKPDVVHLHNLHNAYINIPLLFTYLRLSKVQTVWTLHDCWALTGQCAHYTLSKCNKWKTGCHHCPSLAEYPYSKIDNSRIIWRLKKYFFSHVKNLTIVTPSQWLADQIKESFLHQKNVQVIYNGINTEVFRPWKGCIRNRFAIPPHKYMVLASAWAWSAKKGLDDFIELENRLDNEAYQLIIVGTNSEIDKKLPQNIISINRTQNTNEMRELYSAVDVFVNPTKEEVLGLVNIEANACGTPVVMYKTGGAPECISNKTGIVLEVNDIEALKQAVEYVCKNHPFTAEDCIKHAAKFKKQDKYDEYIYLFEKLYLAK